MLLQFAPSLLAFAASASALPVLRRQDTCASLQVLYIPGTNGDGLGETGTAVQTALAGLTPDSNVEALDYDTSVEYVVTVAEGASKAEDWLTAKGSECPDSWISLVGYSKGAMVLHEITAPTQAIKDKIVAVAVFGDPYTEDTGIVSELTDGAFEDLTGKYPVNDVSEDVVEFCNDGDPFCDGGLDVGAHLAYDDDGSTDQAASFIVNRFNAKSSG